MQTTLLGLAIGIILALVAALVAPLVVDWSHYRAAFEEQASRLTGLDVRVNGAIEARILPTPHLNLHDVEVGEAGAPQLRAGAVELEVGLGPLLRGEVQASELRLIAPQVNLALDRSGAIAWPALSASFSPDALTISRLTVEDGRIVLTDAASGARMELRKLALAGDVHSFLGPFRGEGTVAVGDESYNYRISGSRVDDDGALKLKLAVDPADRPLNGEMEGTLRFAGGVPQFEGTLALARPAGAALARGQRVLSDPWRLAGNVRATPAAASLRSLGLQYGPDERAVNFTGNADVTFGARPHFDGSVAAVQVDVDRMLADPDATHRPPLAMIKNFLEASVATVKPPLPVTLGIGVDAITVGGTSIQSLRGNARYDDSGWSLTDVTLHAPGFTEVKLSGRLNGGADGLAFNGPASVEAADLKTLMAWLEGRDDAPSGPTETLTAQGDVTIASNRFALDHLAASLDREKVEGRVAYSWATGKRPAALDGELHAANLNLDTLAVFAAATGSDGVFEFPRDIALVLDVGKATFAGVDARSVNAKVKLDAGVLHIDRLSVGDLGGAAVNVGGSIDELSSHPRGKLTLDIDAQTLGGLVSVAGRFAPQTSEALRPFAERLSPAKVHGVLAVDRAGAATSARLDLSGGVGALRLTLNIEAAGDPAHPAAANARITSRFDADDGAALLRLLGLDRVAAVDQLPGQMTLSATGPLNGDLRVNGVATAGGFSSVAEGTLRFGGEQSPAGNLQMKTTAADLRPLHRLMTGQTGVAVPLAATAAVAIGGTSVSFTNVAATVGKSTLRGRLALKLSTPVVIGADVAVDEVDAGTVAALLLGLPAAAPGAAAWSLDPVGAGAFLPANGTVTFKLDKAVLTSALTARDLKGTLRLQPSEIAVAGIDGNLAGGRLSGEINFRHDTGAVAAQGHVELTDAKANAAIAANKYPVDGSLTVKLHGEALGRSPDGFVGSFHGTGTMVLNNGQFVGMDPAAFDAAIRLADQSGVVDSAKIQTVVTGIMDNGRLAVPRSEAELTIAAGQIRLANATLSAPGGAELAIDGVADLNKSALDAHMILSMPPATSALIPARPELAISVKGPLASPERRLDVSTLVSWLTLRAAERQTRRLELLEANQRLDVLSAAVRPGSPSVRFIPQGTPLETVQTNPSPAPTLGSTAFDRLHPEAPPPAPRTDRGAAAAALPPASPATIKPAPPNAPSGADRSTAAAAPAPPQAQPGLRSLFDLLFRSQN